MEISLKGRCAVITGGSKGIGLGTTTSASVCGGAVGDPALPWECCALRGPEPATRSTTAPAQLHHVAPKLIGVTSSKQCALFDDHPAIGEIDGDPRPGEVAITGSVRVRIVGCE